VDDEERAREEREQVVNPNRHLKPEGYADAPDWQKAAWDSDVNAKMHAMAADALKEAGSAPLLKEGWCAPSEAVYGYLDIPTVLEFPRLEISRGGMMFPRFIVDTAVLKAEKRFLRRQTWELHVRYWDPEQQRFAHHIMQGFPTENLANNAAEIIKFTIQTINTAYHKESRAR
jgi:hypothetical protein